MMKMNTKNLLGRSSLWIGLLAISLAMPAVAGEKKKGTMKNPYTLAELTKSIDQLQKKKVALSGTIIGACKSGCKMWVADGKYKDGDPFILVRAKDDAFKFKTDAAGKSVKLHGYAVAELLDFCAKEGEKKAKAKGAKTDCAGPGTAEKAITFFAAKVKYSG